MAEPNISLLGATYSGVTGVTLPVSGGGTATFPWVEGSETKTQNGTYDVTNLAQLIVNVSGGGGGTNIETGTYIPASDIAKPTISFSNTHTKLPVFAMMIDADGYLSTSNSNITWYYVCWEQLIGGAVYVSSTTSLRYGEVRYAYRGTNASSLSSSTTSLSSSEAAGDSNTSYPRYWVTESAMYPYTGNTRYWRKDRHYKWIAVWKP